MARAVGTFALKKYPNPKPFTGGEDTVIPGMMTL